MGCKNVISCGELNIKCPIRIRNTTELRERKAHRSNVLLVPHYSTSLKFEMQPAAAR